MTWTEWLQAVHDAPGSSPPAPERVDLKVAERNGWIVRDGDGWRVTADAVKAVGIRKAK